MAYTLNTSHPLYANLIELIGVQSGALVSHKTARTITPESGSSFGTGVWGEHFHTNGYSYTSRGATISPAIGIDTSTIGNYTIVVVVNGSGNVNNGHLLIGTTTPRLWGPRLLNDHIGWRTGLEGSTAVGTGARMLTSCRIGELGGKLYLDKTLEASTVALGAEYNDPGATANYLGSADQSGISDIVWAAVFNKELTLAEITDLYNSLGANNAFGLVQAAGNAAPTFPGPNIGNQTGTVGTALTANNVASKFSDTDALTFSAVGSWPPGVTVSSTGVISGTPTAAGTYASLKVRATDTAAQTVDSDTFTFTISAASTHLITVANSQQTNTASSAAILQTGNGTITLPALKDWGTGNVKAGETGITLIISNATTGVLVSLLTGQTTNASGVLPTLTGLVSGTTYRITTILADGSEGTWKYTAA